MSEVKKMDILVILGGPISKEAEPSEWLKARIIKAIEIIPLIKPTYIIPTGGDTQNIGVSEADVIEKYLLPYKRESVILKETRALNTVLNGYYVRRMINNISNVRLYVLTSDFHIERSRIIFEYYCKGAEIIMVSAKSNVSSEEYDKLLKNELKLIERLKEKLR